MAKDKGKKEEGKKKADGNSAIEEDGGKERTKKVVKYGTIVVVVLIVGYVVVSIVTSIASAVGEFISPSSKQAQMLPVYPTFTLKHDDVLHINDGCYINIDTSMSGAIIVPDRWYVHFKPVTFTAYEIWGKGWNQPIIDFPTGGTEQNPLGTTEIRPNEFRFRVVPGKNGVTGTVFVSVTPDQNTPFLR